MKRRILCILLNLLIVSFLGTGLVYAQDADKDFYHIGINPEQGTWAVDGILKNLKNAEKICLPAFGQRYGEALEVLKISDLDGKDLGIKTDEYGCFRMARDFVGLKFSYVLKMLEPESGRVWVASGLSAYHRGKMFAFPGESVFVERSGGRDDIETLVELRMPDGRESLVSTLEEIASEAGNRRFRAKKTFDLNRSYWATGVPYVRSFAQDDTHWTIAIAEEWRGGVGDIESDLRQILGYYRKLMGERTPKDLAIFVFPAAFDANYQHGMARPGGLILQMGQKSSRISDQRRLLIAHELFHLYNGEGLLFDESEYTQTAWFREGMTQYNAFQALFGLGMTSMSSLYRWLAACLNQLEADSKGSIHLSEQERAYYHGFLLSMTLDNQWSAHRTRFNTRDFFRWLGDSVYWDKKLTNALIMEALSQYSSFDYKDFFKYYITGKEALPVESILSVNQMCIYEIKSIQYHLGLTYRLDVNEARIVADRVEPGSVADQAGIQAGDILVPTDQMDWQDGSTKTIYRIRNNQIVQMRIPVFGVPVVTREIRRCF